MVGLGVWLAVGVCVGVCEGLAVRVGEADSDGVDVGVTDAEKDAVDVSDVVGVTDGDGVGDAENEGDAVGDGDGVGKMQMADEPEPNWLKPEPHTHESPLPEPNDWKLGPHVQLVGELCAVEPVWHAKQRRAGTVARPFEKKLFAQAH